MKQYKLQYAGTCIRFQLIQITLPYLYLAPTVSTPTASPTAPVPTPPSTTIEYVGNHCPDGKWYV